MTKHTGKVKRVVQSKSNKQTTIEAFDIGQAIRRLRKNAGLKCVDIAKKVGVKPEYISLIERQNKLPSPETFIRIMDQIPVSRKDLNVIYSYYLKRKFPAYKATGDLFRGSFIERFDSYDETPTDLTT